MKNKAKRLLALLLVAVMVQWYYPMGSEAEVYAADAHAVSVTEEGDSIVIGNDYISREFSIANDKLETVNITNKRTDGGDTVFTPAEGSEEFIIKTTKKAREPISLEALDRTGWTAVADSYHNASGASDGPGSNLIDGNVDSIWHTNYGGGTGDQEYPYNVVITLNGEKEFKSFSYTPRQQGENTNGNILGYELWAAIADTTLAVDDSVWEKIAEGEFAYDGVNPIYVNLDNPCTANQVKLVATSSKNGSSFAGGAEFNLHNVLAPVVLDERSFAASDLELSGEPVVTDTTATINDVEKTGKKITFNFKPYTFKDVEYTISESIVMYDGDHFMRKYMEISVPADKKADAVIDYIDLESMNVNESDATWTIPRTAGGIVEMDQFKANLGQPIYIQGMFFGCEFPAADTEIVDGTGFMRYYTGKSFERLVQDSQAVEHDNVVTYNTWQTVAGAARSTEQEVIQADFFEYISSIATPSEFRIQYNSWFDNMMLIDDENILESFIEIDRELNAVETRPLDSYVVDDGWNNYNNNSVVDANRSGTTLNESGFWEFNSKFPEGLTPSSELVQNFGSNFGVWVGPRGGYNFYGTLADILVKNGTGSKAGGSIDVADRVYVENFQDMAIEWQNDYGVNYWKWDGFADRAQFNAFPAADGVPGYANNHMTGGYQNMYHVTDLWEAWIDLMEACRANEKENGIKNLWISLTCYVNPSPWYLQWANSVWLQCTHDQKDAGFGLTKMNKQITYRDATYYDYIKNHEFQFPLSNIYNHDPVYGVEGTGMNINTATDEDFKNYLYMLSTRGTAFWELYYSDSIMTQGKYEVTGEFLEWAEENYHMLKNAKMIGGQPDNTFLGNASTNEAYANAYGFSCFDGTDGILSLRNPATTEKTITFTFDRTMGVAEDAGTLQYHIEHSYNLTDGTAATGTLEYGKEYTITLQPNEVRILRVSADGDTTAPEYTRAYTDGDKTITVRFDEKVDGSLFTVDGVGVSSIEKSADDITYRITLAQALTETTDLTVTAKDIKDLAGNALAEQDIVVTYVPKNKVAEETVSAAGEIAAEADSIASNNGFTVAATVETVAEGAVVSQGEAYQLGINADGKAYFTLNGATATSKDAVADGATIVGVKENNGILKLYVNGELAGSAYNAENRYYEVPAAAITAGGAAFGETAVSVYDIAKGYDVVAELGATGEERTPIDPTNMTVSVSGTSELSGTENPTDVTDDQIKNDIFDDNNTDTYWTSNVVEAIEAGDPYLTVDLGDTYLIDRVDYTKRYASGHDYNCTGNITEYVVEVSENGTDWTTVSTGAAGDGTTEITFDVVEAKYIRLSGTASYFWDSAQENKRITVADLDIYGEAKDATNIALNKEATAAWTADGTDAAKGGDRPMSMAVDGSKDNTAYYGEFGADNNTAPSYMQVDLGKVSEIESINLYRYWQDGRTYKNTVVAIAKTEADFAEGNAYIVYNTDVENVQGLGEGTDTEYAESASGHTFTLDSTVEGRYVRVYMNGVKNGGTTNHVVELEVMGYQSDDTVGEVGVDISALINRLAELAQVDTTGSTAASVAEFEALVQEGYDLVAAGAQTQEEVNVMIAKLVDAEDILVDRPAVDKSELESAIEAAEELSADDYTADSWAEFQTALDAANAVNNNADATQEAVNEALAALQTAQEALALVPGKEPADPADDSKDIPVDQYTTAAGSTQTGNSTGSATDNNTNTYWEVAWGEGQRNPGNLWYQIELDEAIEIEALRYYPRYGADYATNGTANGFITAYRVEVSMDGSEWETAAEGTWALEAGWKIAEFDEAVTAKYVRLVATGTFADIGNNSEMSIAEIRVKATTEIVDTAELEAAIKEAEGLTAANYTTASWAAFQTAVDAAEAVLAKEDATQSEINAAVNALAAAKAALVNKEVLEAAIKDAEKLSADDYTEESWNTFAAALSAAKEVDADANATQVAVDKAVDDLAEATKTLEKKVVNPFEDVKESDYYYDEVLWAFNKGITAGTSKTTFAPGEPCTRGQIVTFLWNAAGRPEAKDTSNPFEDVVEGAYYYKAVLWAVENNITAGTTKTTFSPDEVCTRGQIVTFLWNAQKRPEVTSTENPFEDVAEGTYYYQAILWAVENELAYGIEADTFSPDEVCTRGQIVTFLYRYYNPAE